MKLYYAPGACSLADHIALEELGIPVELERVDLKTKRTESGADYLSLNPKGYVPALVLDDGQVVTENLAVLDWIAAQNPSLGLEGALGRTRLLEALAFISTELHKGFRPLFAGGDDAEVVKAKQQIAQRFVLLVDWYRPGPYVFGARLSVADCYLFVILLWAMRFGIETPDALLALRGSMVARPAVQRAMEHEGLRVPLAEGSLQKRAAVA